MYGNDNPLAIGFRGNEKMKAEFRRFWREVNGHYISERFACSSVSVDEAPYMRGRSWDRRMLRLLLVGMLSVSPLLAQGMAGVWQGKLDIASKFRIVFRIEKSDDGSLRGVLYQPDESADGIVLSSVTFANGELRLTQNAMDAAYWGKASADAQSIEGTLTRQGKAYGLNLVRTTPEAMWKYERPIAALAPMASSPAIAFEVATIKPSRPNTPRAIRTRDRTFTATGATLENLVSFAWQLRAPRIDGLPDWAKTEKFDIRAEPNASGQPSQDQDREMLQKLLVERFQLKTHTVKREFSVLALSLEQKHTSMAPSEKEFWSGSIYTKEMPSGDTQVQFVGQSMPMFADVLMNFIREHQIVDETGLDGHFNFILNVNTADLKNPSEDVRGDAVRRAVSDAGFRLTQKRVSLSVLVADAVEKPSEN